MTALQMSHMNILWLLCPLYQVTTSASKQPFFQREWILIMKILGSCFRDWTRASLSFGPFLGLAWLKWKSRQVPWKRSFCHTQRQEATQYLYVTAEWKIGLEIALCVNFWGEKKDQENLLSPNNLISPGAMKNSFWGLLFFATDSLSRAAEHQDRRMKATLLGPSSFLWRGLLAWIWVCTGFSICGLHPVLCFPHWMGTPQVSDPRWTLPEAIDLIQSL